MKKKIFVKIFAISLCLSTIFSTVVMAKDYKEVKQYKSVRIMTCSVAPHPSEVEIPD